MNLAGVIFDFDGVVVDSLGAHLTAWKIAYKKLYGLELGDTKDLPGRSTSSIANILANRAGNPTSAESLATEKKELLRNSEIKIEAFPGAVEAFTLLTKKSIPFGIASNAPRKFIQDTLKNLSVHVPFVFGVDDVPRAKPAPDIFLKCAREIGIKFTDHHRTIVFEDSLHGLEAAVTAGMYPIGVTTQHNENELMKAGAKRTFVNILDAITQGFFN